MTPCFGGNVTSVIFAGFFQKHPTSVRVNINQEISMREQIVVLISLFLLSVLSWSQQPATSGAPAGAQQSMPGMDMSGHDMSNMNMKDMPMGDNDASVHAMHSMEGHMDMGPHMKMTSLRPAKPGDAEHAKEVVEEARKGSDHYPD